MALQRRVVRRWAAWLAAVFFFAATILVLGQGDDPSEIFLKAYLSAQQGEKLERQDRFKTALAKYRFAGSLIEELRKSQAQWQPAVVEYRGRKISEAILRLQERLTRQTQLNASASPLPDIASAAPESDAWSEPGPEALAPQPRETVNERSRDTSVKVATKNLRDKDTELQAALDKTRGDLETARKQTDAVATRVKQTNATAEEKVRKLSEADPKSTEKLAEMERQTAQLQQQLTETENRNSYLAARAAELDVELEHTSTELQAARLAGANSEDSSQLARENELLRNIVVRERQEEARRNEVRKLVLAELDRLKVRSELLNKEIEFLAQPVTRLTTEELALFRQPVVSISNERPGVLKMSFVFEKKSTPNIGKSNAISTAAPNALPNELQDVAVAARKNVEQGKYRTAEKQYQTVLAKDPKNLDALSNLGVVYFRTGKIQSAESTLT